MKILKIVGATLLAVTLLAGAASYSLTYTMQGRIDYAPALLAKLASWQPEEMALTPQARALSNDLVRKFLPYAEPAALARVEDRTIVGPGGNDIPLRIYWPETEGLLPMYLDIHGGGWWMGNGFPFHASISHFAKSAGVLVVSVDYRLAPEHPYPAALDDAYAALLWMHAHAQELGADPARIAVGGGSAGGNLAAAVTLRARDSDGPALAFQYLLVPATDLSDNTEWLSYQQAGDDYMLKVSGVRAMTDAYVPDPAKRQHPYVSPLLAESLQDLPPALIVTAQFDPLRDQGKAYADRLREAGVAVQFHQEDAALHGFMAAPERMKRVQTMAAEAVRVATTLD